MTTKEIGLETNSIFLKKKKAIHAAENMIIEGTEMYVFRGVC